MATDNRRKGTTTGKKSTGKSNAERRAGSNTNRNSSNVNRVASNRSKGNTINNSKTRRKKQNNGASVALIFILSIICVCGIVAIVFLSKELMGEDSVVSTTETPFTANISVKNIEAPINYDLKAEEFIVNPDNISGVTVKFASELKISGEGKYNVDIEVSTADGAKKNFAAELTVYEDKDAPVITGVVNRHFNIGDNITYLKNVKAMDEKEGEVEVKVDNSAIKFDANNKPEEGEYKVVYTATDKSGNTASEEATFFFENNGINDEMIDAAVQKVMSQIIKDDMTIEQKAFAIYNYTYDNIAYTGSSEKGDYRAEAYRGLTNLSGDCYTYFSVAKVLLEEIGVKTEDVERAPGVRNDHHYWLLVDLGTGYYHFDATRRANWFNGFMATDAQVEAYSTNVVNGFYYFDKTLHPATPTEEFKFEQYAGATN